MKKIIKNRYVNFYLNAADKLGLNYKILNEKIGLVRIFDDFNSLNISSNVLDVNTQLASSLSANKAKTSILLSEKKIPVPFFRTFSDEKKAVNYALKRLQKGKSIVIKPLSGSLSIGITVRPSNLEQIKKAVLEAFKENSTIMIEEYIHGKHFRITVLDDEIIAVTQRIAANVTTNGEKAVNELIYEKNIHRLNIKLPIITLRAKDMDYLNAEKIELSKIYPKGINIILQLGCDLDIGGERERIDIKKIPSENLKLFVNAAKALSLRFAGIDYITPDIFTPHTRILTAINEVNNAPDPDVHFRDTAVGNNYAAERILESLFEAKDVITKNTQQASRVNKFSLPINIESIRIN